MRIHEGRFFRALELYFGADAWRCVEEEEGSQVPEADGLVSMCQAKTTQAWLDLMSSDAT